jgi:hypothetical protein
MKLINFDEITLRRFTLSKDDLDFEKVECDSEIIYIPFQSSIYTDEKFDSFWNCLEIE